jgi:cytidylate kinase
MPVITINGPIGSGPVPVGQIVSRMLELNFVDRLIFRDAARLIGKPIGALINKEQRVVRFRDRLSSFLQTMLERSAMSGVSGEPYFGRGIETLPPEVYSEMAGESAVATLKVEDKAFIEATTAVVKDLHQQGNVVILGRGANVILADTPDVIHVGLLAPLDVRAETMMEREHLGREEAEEFAEELERARVAFFRKFFKVHPNDPSLYHIMLNMGKVQRQTAAEIIVHAAGDLVH